MTQDYSFTLGELVYAIRKINKLTQVEYSKKLGVVQSTISKVEKDVFDDVPFSLISKISNDFKVPLTHFQMGHLPLRKNAILGKVIPAEYTKEGIFKAKTVFHILKELSKNYGPNIYKEIKLPHQLMSLSNITYSFEFINKLYSLTQDKLVTAIKSVKVKGEQESSSENIKRYISSLYGINLNGSIDTIFSGNGLSFKFNSSLHELDKIYALLLELEMKLIFNADFSISANEDNETFNLSFQELPA